MFYFCVCQTCFLAFEIVVTLETITESLKLKLRYLISQLNPCIFSPLSGSIKVKEVVVKSFCYQHYAVCVQCETTHNLILRPSGLRKSGGFANPVQPGFLSGVYSGFLPRWDLGCSQGTTQRTPTRRSQIGAHLPCSVGTASQAPQYILPRR